MMPRPRTFLLNRVRKLTAALALRDRAQAAVIRTADTPDSAEPQPSEKIAQATSNQRLRNLVDQIRAVRLQGQNKTRLQQSATRQALLPRRESRVLCIDDDDEYVQALRLRLTSYGIHILRASNGLDGYCDAVAQPTDAILLDYQMPNGPGDYILERLKKNPATKDIPVVVITGRKDRTLELKVLNRGAARFLYKPLDFGELMTELHKHLPA